jgi:hypothetical protein
MLQQVEPLGVTNGPSQRLRHALRHLAIEMRMIVYGKPPTDEPAQLAEHTIFVVVRDWPRGPG